MNRTLAAEDFIWKVLQHVLPRRFRRVRDYGFLHHNAKNKLMFIQYLLGVKTIASAIQKPIIRYQQCQCTTQIIGATPERIPINFRFVGAKIVLNVQRSL